MAVDIARFLSGIESPVARVQQGITFGQQQADRRAAQQSAQAQAEQQKKVQAELLALSQKENRTADDFQDLIIRNPGLAKTFQTSIEQLNTEAQAANISEATNVFAALSSGNTDAALKIIEDRKEAAENSGDQQEVQKAEVLIQAIKANPDAALTSAGLFLAQATGPERFAATLKAVSPPVKKQTALQEKISELQTTGLTREQATRIAAGRTTTSIDPITREVTVIDKATGRRVGGDTIQDPGQVAPVSDTEAIPDPEVGEKLSTGRLTETDFSKAFGPGGFVRDLGNKVADFFGAGLPAEQTDQAIKDLDFLNASTLSVIRGGIDGRVNVQLQERFERLLPESARLFSGAQGALNQVDALVRGMNEEAERLSLQLSRNVLDPKQTVVARQKVDALKQLVSSYQQILNSSGTQGQGDINRFFR